MVALFLLSETILPEIYIMGADGSNQCPLSRITWEQKDLPYDLTAGR